MTSSSAHCKLLFLPGVLNKRDYAEYIQKHATVESLSHHGPCPSQRPVMPVGTPEHLLKSFVPRTPFHTPIFGTGSPVSSRAGNPYNMHILTPNVYQTKTTSIASNVSQWPPELQYTPKRNSMQQYPFYVHSPSASPIIYVNAIRGAASSSTDVEMPSSPKHQMSRAQRRLDARTRTR